jgi:response regulator RpfG family c-di-GMP phosphodiesterase
LAQTPAPDRDDIEVMSELRANGKQIPILILTARDGVDDSVEGLDYGADDYLLKPFAMKELAARLRASYFPRLVCRESVSTCWHVPGLSAGPVAHVHIALGATSATGIDRQAHAGVGLPAGAASNCFRSSDIV